MLSPSRLLLLFLHLPILWIGRLVDLSVASTGVRSQESAVWGASKVSQVFIPKLGGGTHSTTAMLSGFPRQKREALKRKRSRQWT